MLQSLYLQQRHFKARERYVCLFGTFKMLSSCAKLKLGWGLQTCCSHLILNFSHSLIKVDAKEVVIREYADAATMKRIKSYVIVLPLAKS